MVSHFLNAINKINAHLGYFLKFQIVPSLNNKNTIWLLTSL